MIKKIIKEYFSKQFYKFLLAGGFAALVNFFSRKIMTQVLVFEVAVVIAYILGMFTAFTLCKLFVFEKSDQGIYKEFMYFTLVNVAAIIQTVVISIVLARWLLPGIGVREYIEDIAHFIGICVPVITSFIGHKKLTFKAADENSPKVSSK